MSNPTERGPKHSMMLHAIATTGDGLSGRALRKLPFMAHALFSSGGQAAEDIGVFLEALHRGVQVRWLSSPLRLTWPHATRVHSFLAALLPSPLPLPTPDAQHEREAREALQHDGT